MIRTCPPRILRATTIPCILFAIVSRVVHRYIYQIWRTIRIRKINKRFCRAVFCIRIVLQGVRKIGKFRANSKQKRIQCRALDLSPNARNTSSIKILCKFLSTARLSRNKMGYQLSMISTRKDQPRTWQETNSRSAITSRLWGRHDRASIWTETIKRSWRAGLNLVHSWSIIRARIGPICSIQVKYSKLWIIQAGRRLSQTTFWCWVRQTSLKISRNSIVDLIMLEVSSRHQSLSPCHKMIDRVPGFHKLKMSSKMVRLSRSRS